MDFYASPQKCEFHKDTIKYLGFILSLDGLRMSEDKDIQSFLGFCNFYRCFINGYSDIVIPLTCLMWKSAPWDFNKKCRNASEKLKQEFTHAPILMQWVPDSQMVLKTDASDYALAAILSVYTMDGEIHLVAFHSRSFNPTELNYDTHDKELLAIFEAFKHWWQYFEGSANPVDVVTNHKNLEYFSTTKLLTHRQARWSEYLSQFNLVIRFHPRKLEAKPDMLTRCWGIYCKGGNSDFASVNPTNFQPVFTQEQLTSSLRATYFATPVLQQAVIMDVEKLHHDIRTSLPLDPLSSAHLPTPVDPNWTIDKAGLLRHFNWIYGPDVVDLCLKVLQYKHDHILSGTLDKTKPSSLSARNMSGQTSAPSSRNSANPV
ncbi:DNA/RNA polymerase [Tricholoma matsutake]|nr:DNA/RNA polymerase [Tricholoma matsutake 945]